MTEIQLLNLLPVIIPFFVQMFKKKILKELNPAYIPVGISVLGLLIGVINTILGTSFDVQHLSSNVIESMAIALSSIGVHQVYSKGKRVLNGKPIE